MMNWGQVPTASIHRSDVLFTTRFRDLGAGRREGLPRRLLVLRKTMGCTRLAATGSGASLPL